MSNDVTAAREFAKHIHVNQIHLGAAVELVGDFLQQEFEGPSRLAGSRYQFVIDPQLALVAILPDGFTPEPGVQYRVKGKLQATGQFGAFPGLLIQTVDRK
jgi:hypothetical protein